MPTERKEKRNLPHRHPLIIEHNVDWLNSLNGLVKDGVLKLPFSFEIATTFEQAEKLLHKKTATFTDLIAMPELAGPDADWEYAIEFARKFNLPVTILTGSDDLVYRLRKQNIRAVSKNLWDTSGEAYQTFITDPRI